MLLTHAWRGTDRTARLLAWLLSLQEKAAQVSDDTAGTASSDTVEPAKDTVRAAKRSSTTAISSTSLAGETPLKPDDVVVDVDVLLARCMEEFYAQQAADAAVLAALFQEHDDNGDCVLSFRVRGRRSLALCTVDSIDHELCRCC